ncbi:protein DETOXIFICATION 46, chloroplastic-like isoform X1 [Lycium barbarum]|uniref:protein DETOXIFICATION 46, chloroplastic-like isoform X1 n=1 Tax=Lycium barbarum TaxID=112863 RepID=UPI00293E76FD|nr:protein DETOXIFICATION 46, chloroplastic-like isoform X1 [Lycium barbarum]
MNIQTLTCESHIPIKNPKFNPNFHVDFSSTRLRTYRVTQLTRKCNHRKRIITACVNPSQEIPVKLENLNLNSCNSEEKDEEQVEEVTVREEITVVNSNGKGEFSGNESIWAQMVEIVKFSGPAVGLWLCGPLMSLIDTAVIGQGSSIELAALGPGTVFCDNTSYAFMFLSIATSNLVATALARQDKDEVQHQISILLFIGLACGVVMFSFTRMFGAWGITAFTGAKNTEIINAANTYVQIRGLAWPAMLVGWVAQSASLGMKDSWGPLKALAVATAINGIGDIVLCRIFGYGIAGAAWATMVSQVVAAYMMIQALNNKGYNGFALSVPSVNALLQIFMLAAPVFLTMMSKVAFYSLLVYYATSMGTHSAAAHQVMLQLFCLFAVWAEPLSQTAQSFMPELLYGVNRNLSKARMLLKSLLIIGASNGLLLGSAGVSISWFFPKLFSPDPLVIQEMHKVLLPMFLALWVSPCVHSLEGTLLAARDLKFISGSMASVFGMASLLVILFSSKGFGLAGCWFALVAFQWTRFSIALWRLTLADGILYLEDSIHDELEKLKVA